MSWQATARSAVQRVGLQPRYLRRLRWITKARAVSGVGASVPANLRFVLLDPEPANFTYELANEDELAAWVQAVSGVGPAEVERVLDEVHGDQLLAQRLRAATAGHGWWTKRSPPFGKRIGWYALARLLKPALIVETGVHDGLGSLLLLRALERNVDEGGPGRLVSFDINPAAGWIAGSHPLWELRLEPTRDGLDPLLARSPEVGIFIHDSLHTYENERFELRTAGARLAGDGVLISDNVHGTHALADTCEELGLEYTEFHERSRGHFYPGGAMGAGRRPRTSS
jgi:hypothetical protein